VCLIERDGIVTSIISYAIRRRRHEFTDRSSSYS
jgi:hypothetical protein